MRVGLRGGGVGGRAGPEPMGYFPGKGQLVVLEGELSGFGTCVEEDGEIRSLWALGDLVVERFVGAWTG